MLLILQNLFRGLNLRLILMLEKKIPDSTSLATKSSVNRLITDQEDYTDRVK